MCYFRRLPFSFVTDEVVQATCQCLLAQAAEAESVCSAFLFLFVFLSLLWELNRQEQIWRKQSEILLELFLVITFHSCEWNGICQVGLSLWSQFTLENEIRYKKRQNYPPPPSLLLQQQSERFHSLLLPYPHHPYLQGTSWPICPFLQTLSVPRTCLVILSSGGKVSGSDWKDDSRRIWPVLTTDHSHSQRN